MSARKKPTDSLDDSRPNAANVPPGWRISCFSRVTGESFFKYEDGRVLDEFGKVVLPEDRPEIHETFAPNAIILGPVHAIHIPLKNTVH